ncbi:N-acetyltransferase [Pullulanibacillus camelliae]|uniref:N-acetyltransferase n=1 Tax=Pullulanibacillus camelliae TaxID=1707096 RepID=A0A8J3DZ82_9BACL|nr:GNAT family N-acetyltransferase [Pullulanibacillus camelliae]GGE51438.1 N-acetyltransferase [Pullulanibacillus camelliae]
MKIIVVENEHQYEDALKVRKQVFIDEQQVPMELEVDAFENEATHLVAYNGNSPIGAGRFRIKSNAAKVERICVLKDFRRQNIGLHIMQKIEELATELRLSELILHAQTHAQHFYEKLGYQVTSDVFYDANMPHVEMKKVISKAS